MPLSYQRRVRRVTHIGHFDPAGASKPSPDGPGIAVSTCPEDWRRIAGLNGPEYQLDWPPAEWLDILSWEASDVEELISWAQNLDYIRETIVFKTVIYNEKTDDYEEFADQDLETAAARVGRSADQELEARNEGRGAVEEERVWMLTRVAVRRLGGPSRYPDPLIWYDGVSLLYAREVVLRKRPMVVGIWWNHPNDAKAGLAPYGVIFPERLHHFTVTDEEGERRDFSEAYPEIVKSNPETLVTYD